MYDDIDYGGPVDFDDFELPDPEGDEEEDVSEEPTVVAATAELLAAVTARVHTQHSVGEVELEVELEGTEPTLAHQPVPPATPLAAPAAGPAPAAEPQASLGSVLFICLLALLLIAGAVLMVTVAS